MLRYVVLLCAFCGSCVVVRACDSCRSSVGDPESGGSVGLTAGVLEDGRRWSLDTTFEYRNWDRINPGRALAINLLPNGHTHSIQDEWFAAVRVGYSVSDSVAVGISQNYRHLRDVNVNDPLLLGNHRVAQGFGDLELDAKWRFKGQEDNGFPVDLSLFGTLKLPTGKTTERQPDGIPFDAEDQPGSGSFDGTLGLAASRRWGDWGASGAVAFTLKGEGTQEFKAGDVFRVSLSTARKLPYEPCGCKLYVSLGMQGLVEFKARQDGEIDRNHGGQTIYAIPGISAKPIDRLTLSTSFQLPVYQELNGFHQKQDFGIQFGVSIRF